MCGMISSSFLLLLGSVLTFAEDAGADSGMLSPPPPHSTALQQGDAVNSPPDGLARDAYMLLDDQGLERLLSSYVSNADSSQPYSHILDDDLPQIVTQLAQQEQERQARSKRLYGPIFVRKTSAPLMIGKKSLPYIIGKKYVPYAIGKRASPYFLGQESAPYLVYEKAAPYFSGKDTSYFVGQRAVGRKSVLGFVGKKSAPLFIGKTAAPMFVAERRLADILDNLSFSNMKELYVSPLARIPSTEGSHLAIPVKWSSGYSQSAENDF